MLSLIGRTTNPKREISNVQAPGTPPFPVAPGWPSLYGARVPVQLTILGSGSAGNCAYVETNEARLLVDAGFSLRQIRKRMASIGRAPEGLSGVLVTHEHSDHISGLAGLCTKLNIPIYCNRDTKEQIEWQLQTRFDCRVFTTGASFEIGDVIVDTFSIPHDASDPVGFLLRTTLGQIGFLTDLGHATKLALQRVRAANVLVLESNHDLKMLQESSRPWSLKQRIAGRHGHLSNTDAADAAQEIMSAELRHLYLGHLSRECNRPQLAREVMDQRLDKLGASHVTVELTHQDVPCPTLSLAGLQPQPMLF
ncbi:MAG TPA: MBL fold metallo-hydrolase [Verrucomicrobiae bacterium]|nr:MBL fold metallo-hydrolase [Verrucomicrobiae bacterium]